jgi:hypothetical protein
MDREDLSYRCNAPTRARWPGRGVTERGERDLGDEAVQPVEAQVLATRRKSILQVRPFDFPVNEALVLTQSPIDGA